MIGMGINLPLSTHCIMVWSQIPPLQLYRERQSSFWHGFAIASPDPPGSTLLQMNRFSTLFWVLLLGLGGCWDPLGSTVPCDTFATNIKITDWPASTRILQEKCISGFNPTYQVELTIQPQDLLALQQQTPLNKIQQWRSQTDSQIFADSPLQQKGKQMQSLLYADFSDGAYLMEVLIDTSDAQQYVVYASNSFVD